MSPKTCPRPNAWRVRLRSRRAPREEVLKFHSLLIRQGGVFVHEVLDYTQHTRVGENVPSRVTPPEYVDNTNKSVWVFSCPSVPLPCAASAGLNGVVQLNFSSMVLTASLPSSFEASGLAPVMTPRSAQTVLSILLFIKFTPRPLSVSLTPIDILPGR